MKKVPAKKILYSSMMAALLLGIQPAKADDYFDPIFVTDAAGNALAVDLSPFETSSYLPGNYRVDIYLNEQYADTQDVEFYTDDKKTQLIPCLSDKQMADLGMKAEYYSLLNQSGKCVSFNDIQGASTVFNASQNRLELKIPQIAFDPHVLEEKQELLWNDGIPAAFSDYSFSGTHTNDTSINKKEDSLYLNLRSGINIGPWRYRNISSWNRYSDGDTQWESQLNYLERPLRSIKSNILVGDNFSDSDVFENVSFRGVKLWSDDQMYPAYASVYAPVITGVARMDSTIEVYQNGYIIYRTNVPAGPYELTDVIPLNNGTNLSVVQHGIDGSEQRFIVPFSSLDFLQRKGKLKYSMTAGQYRMNNFSDNENDKGDKSKFVQTDAFYGITDRTTVFGGFQGASRYQAYDIGLGINIPVVGAIATDVMVTRARPDDLNDLNGSAFRVRYSKALEATGTNINFAGYSYMSGDYISMTDMFDYYTGRSDTSAYSLRKGQLDLSVTQQLPESWGMMTAGISHQNYDNYYNNGEKKVESYNIGYSNQFDTFSFNANYSYFNNTINRRRYREDRFEKDRTNDHVFSVSISIPLKGTFRDNWINYGYLQNKRGDIDNYIGVGGMALDEKNLSWNVQQGYGNRGRGNYGSVYSRYSGGYGDVNAGYSYEKDNRQISYGLNGSLVMSQYGVTLSRPLGDTNGLVYAPGAEGIRVINSAEATTDSSGLAIVSNLIPYRNNLVRLDPLSWPEDAEVELALKEVYPTRGALVLISYETQLGKKILVTLRDAKGNMIPFGAWAEAGGNKERFYVSNFGRLYLSGAAEQDEIRVFWGDDNEHQCRFSYQTEGKRKVNGLYIFDEICQ